MRISICFLLFAATAVLGNDAADLYKQGVAAYERNPSEACALFGQAAEGGHVSAMVGLATCYEKGYGIQENYAKALAWYEKAARENSLRACEGLARIYATCLDPEFHNGPQAVTFATAVVRKKPRDPVALDLLAAAYLRAMRVEDACATGQKGVQYAKSLEQARLLKEKLPSYAQGCPVPPLATEAWLMEAANQDVEWAVVKLARLSADPTGHLYNAQLATHLCEKAVKLGRPELYFDMGQVYFHEGQLDKAYKSFFAAPRNRSAYGGTVPVEVRFARYLKCDLEVVLEWALKYRDGYTATETYMATVTKTGYNPDGSSYSYQEQEQRTREVNKSPDPEASLRNKGQRGDRSDTSGGRLEAGMETEERRSVSSVRR